MSLSHEAWGTRSPLGSLALQFCTANTRNNGIPFYVRIKQNWTLDVAHGCLGCGRRTFWREPFWAAFLGPISNGCIQVARVRERSVHARPLESLVLFNFTLLRREIMYHHIKHVKDEHRKAKSPRTSREEPRSPSKRICSSSSAGVLPSQKHTHPDESVVQNHLVTEKSANNDVRKENIGIARAAPFSLSNQIRSQMEPYERQQQVLKADDSIEDLVLLLDGDAHIMSPERLLLFTRHS